MLFAKKIASEFGPKFKYLFYVLLAIVAITILMTFLIPVNGAAYGSDGWTHLNWLGQFISLFREGHFYPRWMPESFAGYGSAAFYFYPPLCYWIASILSVVMPFASNEMLFYFLALLGSFGSVLTMRSYLKELGFNKEASLMLSFFYDFASYRFLCDFSFYSLSVC